MSTPRIPAEWEPHRAVWLAWPAHEELWGHALASVQNRVVGLCHALAALPGGETIEMLVRDAAAGGQARRALEGLPFRLHPSSYGDIWLRDTAPIFRMAEDGRKSAAAFTFNGWGGKYRLPGDELVAEVVAGLAGVELSRHPLVLEGGALESDGEGTLITTRQCALASNRNPGATEAELEAAVAELFGVRKVIWLEEGLVGDHTDGHVDNLARFVGPGRVVCGQAAANDPNAKILAEVEAALRSARDAAGRKLEVVTLPSPGRLEGEDGKPLPATHLNFVIGNRRVAVPTFGGDSDDPALQVLRSCFPGREVVGIDSRVLLPGGGALHCISRQEPA